MTGAALLGAWLGFGSPPSEPGEPAESEQVSDPSHPIAITTRLGPDPSHVGDLLTLEVVAAYPPGFSVNLPIGLSLGEIEVVSAEPSEPESSGTGLRKTFVLTLQQFATGEQEVPSFPLTWVTPDGDVQTLSVPSVRFTVDSLLANEVDPKRRPEDPPVSLEYPAETAETAILVGASALVAGLGAAWALARWRRRVRRVLAPPPLPPDVEALAALERLAVRRPELVESGRFQDYYLELTEIAKAYLERRFSVPALDRTTEEIRRDLVRAAARIQPLDPDELVRFLQACDLVKFARFAPPAEETESALAGVRDIVERTRRPVEPAPPAVQEVA
jgi:hypothetical protein